MSLDGVIDAPDIVQEAQSYFLSSEEHSSYQKNRGCLRRMHCCSAEELTRIYQRRMKICR
jgi:hypothetical protein